MKYTMLGGVKWLLTVVCAAMALTWLTGCESGNPNPQGKWPVPGSGNVGGSDSALSPYMLRVGDMITVSFSDTPPPGLQEVRARIPEDGMLTLHYNIRVKAAEKSIPQLEQDIRNAFVPRLYKNLTAIVRSEERAFFVGGEVRNPGRFPLLGEMTVLRAIETAGSFTDFAKKNEIELRRESGEVRTINWQKARRNGSLDLPVLPNDHIYVPRRVF